MFDSQLHRYEHRGGGPRQADQVETARQDRQRQSQGQSCTLDSRLQIAEAAVQAPDREWRFAV